MPLPRRAGAADADGHPLPDEEALRRLAASLSSLLEAESESKGRARGRGGSGLRGERKHPKLYWTDPGLARAVKRQLGDVAAEERGALFEGWVLGLLRAHAEEAELFEEIWFWAPGKGRRTEVDFLLRRGREFLAIEAKAGNRFQKEMLHGLRAVGELPRLARRVLVYPGSRSMKTDDGIEIWPVARFARAVAMGELWP